MQKNANMDEEKYIQLPFVLCPQCGSQTFAKSADEIPNSSLHALTLHMPVVKNTLQCTGKHSLYNLNYFRRKLQTSGNVENESNKRTSM